MVQTNLIKPLQLPIQFQETYPSEKELADKPYTFELGAVRLRDGVHTRLDLLRPKQDPTFEGLNIPEKFKVVLMFDYYCEKKYYPNYMATAEVLSRGNEKYIYAIAYPRGRCGSEGERFPFPDASDVANDVNDIIAAINTLPDVFPTNLSRFFGEDKPIRNIFMTGKSYNAWVEFATLTNISRSLATFIFQAPVHPGVHHFPMVNGILHYAVQSWINLTDGPIDDWDIVSDSEFWRQNRRAHQTGLFPLTDWPEKIGYPTPTYERWIAHPLYDEFWKQKNPTCENFRESKLPQLWMTGQYDDPQKLGTFSYYLEKKRCAPDSEDVLLILPSDHSLRFKDFIYGNFIDQNASLDNNQLIKGWFNYVDRLTPQPPFPLEKGIVFYVMKKNEWYHRSSLEVIASEYRSFKTVSSKSTSQSLTSVLLDGTRVDTSKNLQAFVNDPHRLELPSDACSAYENINDPDIFQTYVHCLLRHTQQNNLGIILDTEPFAEDQMVVGFFEFTARLFIDVPSTDFEIQVYEAIPEQSAEFEGKISDPRMIKLNGEYLIPLGMTAPIRFRHRNTLEKSEVAVQSNIYEVKFSTSFVARQISKGSRLRLVLSVPDGLSKTFNGEKPEALQTMKDALIAHIVLVDGVLKVPIFKEDKTSLIARSERGIRPMLNRTPRERIIWMSYAYGGH